MAWKDAISAQMYGESPQYVSAPTYEGSSWSRFHPDAAQPGLPRPPLPFPLPFVPFVPFLPSRMQHAVLLSICQQDI